MNSDFRKFIVRIASLKSCDQKWLLKHLGVKEQAVFNRLQGPLLLKEAKRFKGLTCQEVKSAKAPTLPLLCQNLKQQDPLFIAIILEQGQFSWESHWLNTLEDKERIEIHRRTIQSIKPLTRATLFKNWQSALSFAQQLGSTHG